MERCWQIISSFREKNAAPITPPSVHGSVRSGTGRRWGVSISGSSHVRYGGDLTISRVPGLVIILRGLGDGMLMFNPADGCRLYPFRLPLQPNPNYVWVLRHPPLARLGAHIRPHCSSYTSWKGCSREHSTHGSAPGHTPIQVWALGNPVHHWAAHGIWRRCSWEKPPSPSPSPSSS